MIYSKTQLLIFSLWHHPNTHFKKKPTALPHSYSSMDWNKYERCDLKWASISPGQQLDEQDQKKKKSKQLETPEVQLTRTQQTQFPLLPVETSLSQGCHGPSRWHNQACLWKEKGWQTRLALPALCWSEGLYETVQAGLDRKSTRHTPNQSGVLQGHRNRAASTTVGNAV